MALADHERRTVHHRVVVPTLLAAYEVDAHVLQPADVVESDDRRREIRLIRRIFGGEGAGIVLDNDVRAVEIACHGDASRGGAGTTRGLPACRSRYLIR